MPLKASYRAAALLVSLLLVSCFAFSTAPTEFNAGRDSDGMYYCGMAEHFQGHDVPIEFVRKAPWCWRVLTPLVMSAINGEAVPSARGLNFVLALASLFLAYELLAKIFRPGAAALFGMAVYGSIFWTVRWGFYSPCYVDVSAEFLTLIALVAMVYERYAIIPVILALAALQREAAIFLAPVVFVHFGARRGFSRDAKLYFTALLLAPLAVLGALRLLIVPLNHYSPEAALRIVMTAQIFSADFYPRLALELVSGAGLLLCIPLLALRHVREYLRGAPEWSVMLAMGLVQIFSGYDKSRLMITTLPALLVLATLVTSSWSERAPTRTALWMAACVGTQLCLSFAFTRFASLEDFLSKLVAVHTNAPLYPAAQHFGLILLAWLLLTAILRPGRGAAAEAA